MRLSRTSWAAALSMLWTRYTLARRGYTFRPKASPDPKVLLRLDTCWSLASAMSLVDTARAAEFQAKQSALALSAGDPLRAARALALEAGYVAIAGPASQRQANAILTQARDLAMPLGDAYLSAFVDLSDGIVSYLCGDYGPAIERFTGVEPKLRRFPNANWERSAAVTMAMDARLRAGWWADLASSLPQITAEARHTGNRYVEGFGEFVRATALLLADDRPEDATRAIREFYPRPARSEVTIQDWWGLHGPVPALLYEGAFDEAVRQLASHSLAIELAGLPMITVLAITMHHTRGVAAVGASRRKRGLARWLLLKRAAFHALRLRWLKTPAGDAFADLLDGTIALADGDDDEAAVCFEAAHQGLVKTSHTLFADLALRRRALLAGGDAGAGLVAIAEQGLRRQGVKRPDRLTDAWIPDAR
jgi:hypothetical protein